LSRLFNLAARVPSLLQRLDFSSGKPDHTLLDHLRILQQGLDTWLDSASRIDLPVEGPLSDERLARSDESLQLNQARASLWLLTRESLCRICLLLVAECVDGLQDHKPTTSHKTVTAEMRAFQLRSTTQLLANTARVPICTARAVSAPLHFLSEYYARVGDTAGLKWCAQFKDDILKSAPWLRWDVLLPWTFLTIHDVPMYRV
jgi:hypothetical protein